MKKLCPFLLIGWMTTCGHTESPKVGFHAYQAYDTLFRYQNGKGYFITPRLVGQLDSGWVTSALFTEMADIDSISFTRIYPLHHQQMSGRLVQGKKAGLGMTYYDQDKRLVLRKSNFIAGLRHGLDSIFFPGGKANGVVESFSEYTGNEKSRVSFREGYPSSIMYYFDHYNPLIDGVDLTIVK